MDTAIKAARESAKNKRYIAKRFARDDARRVFLEYADALSNFAVYLEQLKAWGTKGRP